MPYTLTLNTNPLISFGKVFGKHLYNIEWGWRSIQRRTKDSSLFHTHWCLQHNDHLITHIPDIPEVWSKLVCCQVISFINGGIVDNVWLNKLLHNTSLYQTCHHMNDHMRAFSPICPPKTWSTSDRSRSRQLTSWEDICWAKYFAR